jgi:hypothetical protein
MSDDIIGRHQANITYVTDDVVKPVYQRELWYVLTLLHHPGTIFNLVVLNPLKMSVFVK